MEEYIFGANILENLTTGMYQDSKVIFREYVQNACDQIDKAIRDGLLIKGEEHINIWIEPSSRVISIEDNATGIPSADFERTLGNVADSDKKIGEDKGFRGIGRLCGLAYCKELVFKSTSKGEVIISTLRCNAEKMRELIDENGSGKKHTASDILFAINEFTFEEKAGKDEHWFKVELIGINNSNTDLLDFTQIKEYLSFVSPVPYINTFIFRKEIHKHAEEINYNIDEYNINLNGEQIVKKYKTRFKTSKGEDDIFSVEFKDIRDANGNLLAWTWFGVSKFKAIIKKEYQMRGLRLRKENIQIGDEDALQKLFKQDRGHHYFIGEIFAVDRDLIPNSQRDYFNENEKRNQFELEIQRYFNEELSKIYYDGSAINSAYNKIDMFEKKEKEFKEKDENGVFVDEKHREEELEEINKAKLKAMEAKKEIEKKKEKAEEKGNDVVARLIDRIEDERSKNTVPKEKRTGSEQENPSIRKKNSWRTDKLAAYSKKDRKLISKIFGIIMASTDKETAESIINSIEEGL